MLLALFVTVVVALTAFYTKPAPASFHGFITGGARSTVARPNRSWLSRFARAARTSFNAPNYMIRDLGVALYVKVEEADSPLYLGAFGRWFRIDTLLRGRQQEVSTAEQDGQLTLENGRSPLSRGAIMDDGATARQERHNAQHESLAEEACSQGHSLKVKKDYANAASRFESAAQKLSRAGRSKTRWLDEARAWEEAYKCRQMAKQMGPAYADLENAARAMGQVDPRQSATLYLTLAQKVSQISFSEEKTEASYRHAIELFSSCEDADSRLKTARSELATFLSTKGKFQEAALVYDDLISTACSATDPTAATLATFELPQLVLSHVLTQVAIEAPLDYSALQQWLEHKIESCPPISSTPEMRFLQTICEPGADFESACQVYERDGKRLSGWQATILLEKRRRLEQEAEELR